MIHIHPVDLIAKVENLRIGEQLIYYIGALAEDGNVKPNGRLIKATGIIAWAMYEENILDLKKNSKIEVIGTLTEYNNELEILADIITQKT